MSKITRTHTQWSTIGDSWYPIGDAIKDLPPNFYCISYNPTPMLAAINVLSDKIVATGVAAEIGEDIKCFMDNRQAYRSLGFLHKRGILLIGYPGTGKTITSRLVARFVVEHGGVAIINFGIEIDKCLTAVGLVRSVHPEMPIVNIMEDVEAWYEDDPERLLSFLDGQYQTDCIINIATTNFPEKLESRLINRPGRFDVVRWVGPPDAATRRNYLRSICPTTVPDATIEHMANESEGLLLSHMRELVCSTLVHNRPVQDTIKDLRHMIELSNENDAKRKAMDEMISKLPPALAKQLKNNTKQLGELTKAISGKAAA
jgi:SpoVK/Ycf46/Vps4 family AAA+-type ATPase